MLQRSQPGASSGIAVTRAWLARVLLACGALMSVEDVARAGGGAATDAYDGIREGAALDVHGLADVYVQHDLNRPASGRLDFRAFDVRADELSLNFLRLTLAHAPAPSDTGPRLGFRLDAGVGDTPNGYLRSDPAATDHPGLSRALSYVEQAFATMTLPVGRGLLIDAGKFNTPIGLEDNESPSNWNYSRSLLYTLAEPTYHSGLRVTYPLTDTLAATLFWLNGWNANVLEGNGMRSFAGAVSWSPCTSVQIVVAYAGGLERAPTALFDRTLTFRSVLDAYVIYAPTDRISFAVTFDHGLDARGGGVTFSGLAGYLRYKALPWLAGTLRAERFADPEGLTTGRSQRMVEATATIEARGKLRDVTVQGRLEYRRDQSDARVFETQVPGESIRRDTFALGLSAAF